MDVRRCGKGHFFDADIYTECPYCNKTDKAPDVTDYAGFSTPDYRNDPTVMAIQGERELGMQLTQMYADEVDSDEDNEKTIGLSFTADGINPVVGWLVCEEGPEKGRSYSLYSGRNFIGRSHRSDVSVYDDNSISRENHCSVVYEPNQCCFFVVPSPNATTLHNGRILREAILLENEDAFTIGNSTFRMIAYCKKGRSW